MKTLLAALCAGAIALPAVAAAQQGANSQTKAAETKTAAKADDDPNKLVCEMVKPIDSNIKRRVCKTRAQIQKEQEDAKRYMDSKLANQGTAASANPSFGGP